MAAVLKGLDEDIACLIREIGACADSVGVSVRLVGGIVRDLLLGVKSRDIDIVIEGDAVDFSCRWAKTKGLMSKAHPRFGTATVFVGPEFYVDFVTARREIYPVQGGLPRVTPAAFENDIFRRDFTVNGLAVKLNGKDYGSIVDICHGREDLKDKVIRVFHAESFADDPTRILRAIRFEQRFGFHMDRQSLRWLKEALEKKSDCAVSRPRYFAEFRRFFSEPDPVKCLNRFARLGGTGFLRQISYDADFFSALRRRIARMRQSGVQFKNWPMLYFLGLFWSMPDKVLAERVNEFQICKREKILIQKLPVLRDFLGQVGSRSEEDFFDFFDRCPEEIVLFVRTANLSKIKGSAWASYANR